MSKPSIQRRKVQGFDGFVLQTEKLELVLIPSLGAKVVSLLSRRTGREWLWHREGECWLWTNKPGDGFGAGPQAGIDECLPTVSACRFGDLELADHGDLWTQAWELDAAALDAGILRTSARLVSMPLTLVRSIEALSPSVVEFRYELENLGDREESFLWCLHPLFAIYPGDRVELPAEVVSLKLNGGLGVPISQGDIWAYPEPFPGISLNRLVCPGGEGSCVKGFAGPLSEGRAALLNGRTGACLSLTWDAVEVPMLGFWLNRGHAGFHHVALEPTQGAPDSLADAVGQWKRHASVSPHGRKTWSVRWNITDGR